MNRDVLNKIKLISLIAVSTFVIFIKEYRIILPLLIIIIVGIVATKAGSKVISRVQPVCIIALGILLFQVIFNVSVDFSIRLELGFLAAIKFSLLSLLVFFYTTTTSVSAIVSSFSFLPAPLQMMLAITCALIPILFDESRRIQTAQSARGSHKHAIMPIIIPLIHRTLQRAKSLSIVLESRGYRDE
jgi:energy-coupling factor transporter transmembrane protein EcfT